MVYGEFAQKSTTDLAKEIINLLQKIMNQFILQTLVQTIEGVQ